MKKHYLMPLVVSGIFAFGLWLGYILRKPAMSPASPSSEFEQILDLIENNYVDSVDPNKLKTLAFESMLEKLDPHSTYIPADEFKQINEEIKGSFEGIGIQFRIQDDTIIVVDVIPHGPSEKVGILRGDRIIEVEGKKVTGIHITNEQVLKMLKGPKGTKVKVTIYRPSAKRKITFSIIRNVIPLRSIDAFFMLNPTTGYIKLSTFNAKAAEEMENALKTLKSQGMKNLILDLRNNGGGLLDAAINIADMFLPKGFVIVSTKGLHRKESIERSSSYDVFPSGKLIILLNEFSASASEIVAGAIQDNDRGLIVGRRSFGKGLVQDQFTLKNGAAIRLTVARYYTPSGRCIQRPYTENTEKYYLDFFQQLTSNDSLLWKYNTVPKDSTPYFTTKGRKVYGGGGIYPDIVVLHDFSINFTTLNNILSESFISNLFRYIEKNRKTLIDLYPTEETYIRNYTISDETLSELIDQRGYKLYLNLPKNEKNEVQALVKAYMARELYDIASFYKILSTIDKTILKALEVVSTSK